MTVGQHVQIPYASVSVLARCGDEADVVNLIHSITVHCWIVREVLLIQSWPALEVQLRTWFSNGLGREYGLTCLGDRSIRVAAGNAASLPNQVA